MTDARRHTRSRRRDRWAEAGVVLLAVVAGLVAAHFGTHKSWEKTVTTPAAQQGSR
jgi:hypothetical protein